MSVSATEAAFEGFRLTRRRPGAVLLWAAVWLVGLIAMLVAVMPIMAPWMTEITSAQGDASALSAGATAAMQQVSLAFIPIALLIQGLLSAAIYRAVLRPQETSLGSLRLGKDEGRVLVVGVAIGLVSGILNVGGEWLANQVAASAGMLAGAALSLVVFVALLVLSVRLSLIAPLTFLRRKLSFREGWKASGRLFWPLLGMTIVVLTLTLVVVLLLVMIAWPMQMALAAAGGASSPAAALGGLLILLLIPLGLAMVSTLAWAPFAAICRDLPESQAAQT